MVWEGKYPLCSTHFLVTLKVSQHEGVLEREDTSCTSSVPPSTDVPDSSEFPIPYENCFKKNSIISFARQLARISLRGKMLRRNWERTAKQHCSRSWKARTGIEENKCCACYLSPSHLFSLASTARKALGEAIPHKSFHLYAQSPSVQFGNQFFPSCKTHLRPAAFEAACAYCSLQPAQLCWRQEKVKLKSVTMPRKTMPYTTGISPILLPITSLNTSQSQAPSQHCPGAPAPEPPHKDAHLGFGLKFSWKLP